MLVNKNLTSVAMIDSGATSLYFDAGFSKANKLKPRKRSYLDTLRVVDSRDAHDGAIMHEN